MEERNPVIAAAQRRTTEAMLDARKRSVQLPKREAERKQEKQKV